MGQVVLTIGATKGTGNMFVAISLMCCPLLKTCRKVRANRAMFVALQVCPIPTRNVVDVVDGVTFNVKSDNPLVKVRGQVLSA